MLLNPKLSYIDPFEQLCSPLAWFIAYTAIVRFQDSRKEVMDPSNDVYFLQILNSASLWILQRLVIRQWSEFLYDWNWMGSLHGFYLWSLAFIFFLMIWSIWFFDFLLSLEKLLCLSHVAVFKILFIDRCSDNAISFFSFDGLFGII